MSKKRVPRASAQFEGADLADERLKKRLKKTAETLAAPPASSLPRATANESELEGVYRLGRWERWTSDAAAVHGTAVRHLDVSRAFFPVAPLV